MRQMSQRRQGREAGLRHQLRPRAATAKAARPCPDRRPAGAAVYATAAARPPARAGPSWPSSPARRPRGPGRAPGGRRGRRRPRRCVEPVPSTRRRTRDGSDARQANSCGTKRLAASSLASGENTCPATPCSGSSAPFRLITACSPCGWSSAMRAAMAAPAECPISTVGAKPISRSSAATPRAMPGSVAPSARAASLKPWPGRSTASTAGMACQQRNQVAP